MDMQQERPPAYTQHEPESLHLPSVPTHAPTTHDKSSDRLPGIRSLDLPDATAARPHASHPSIELSPRSQSQAEHAQWGSLPPLSSATFPRVPEGMPRSSTEIEIGSPMDTASVVSAVDDSGRPREMSVLSVDDPDVRLAAEALSGLGNPDFVRSPTTRSLTLPRESTAEPEPLLSLITSNHPWLGGTINGSISAYNYTKGYSPRFVKYGAELIERNIGSPVVNTVSSLGRQTGMEQNLRRYLGEGHRRPSDDLEQGNTGTSRKRQRIMSPDAMDLDEAFKSPRTRGGSESSYVESLPAYDDQRSPKYEETTIAVDLAARKETESPRPNSQDRRVNWSTQLIMTTSGLGVALSDASLRSLKLCLGLLRSATKHIDSVMKALQVVLEEYEAALRNRRQSDGEASEPAKMDVSVTASMDSEKEDQVRRIADRMKSLSSDIWTTLQNVVQSVSRYTGGALPQNASQVVRTQLLSVPQRWQLARRSAAEHDAQGGTGEEARGAQRMLAFAKEGLDMMGQITAVVDGTVQSAETWLARIGRGVRDGEAGASGDGDGDGSEREKEKVAFPVVDLGEKR
ncbi:clock-controlled protein-like protein 8 [Lojkania enalia]|uniref:Clock-controlled protein-like protein 8 n=1 Tax=Lojkania enalia TaxID=147567 RepID=A0A9P4NA66_9PLEO|nr:clock-controlled protein-like protein 8 [Didymosphaeria enalia]